jgi:hypothetical protein
VCRAIGVSLSLKANAEGPNAESQSRARFKAVAKLPDPVRTRKVLLDSGAFSG